LSLSADMNQTVTAPNGIVLSRARGKVVHPDTPKLSEDTQILTPEGEPFVVNGVPVKFGMLPIERRWAVNASGKMLEQRDFEDKHFDWYTLHFKAKDKTPDDATSRPIPLIERFLSDTWGPSGEDYRMIGFDPNRTAEGPAVRPDFKLNDTTELSGYEQVKESDAEKRATAAEAELATLRAKLAETPEPAKPKRRGNKPFAAKCGQMIRGGQAVHIKHCTAGCNDPEPTGEAA